MLRNWTHFIDKRWADTFVTGHFDEALSAADERKDPLVLTRHRLALLYAERKMYNEAITGSQRTYSDLRRQVGTLTRAYVCKGGHRREALEQVDSLIAASTKRFVSPGSIAIVIRCCEGEHTVKWLEKANAEHDLLALRIKTDPFESLRGDPRFADL